MLFRTKTSIYFLRIKQGLFILTKVALLPGATSSVAPGTVFSGNRLEQDLTGSIFLYNDDRFVVKTSPIVPERI